MAIVFEESVEGASLSARPAESQLAAPSNCINGSSISPPAPQAWSRLTIACAFGMRTPLAEYGTWAEASQPPPSGQPLGETKGASRACQRARSPCKLSATCQLPCAANDIAPATGSSSSTNKRSVPAAPD